LGRLCYKYSPCCGRWIKVGWNNGGGGGASVGDDGDDDNADSCTIHNA